MVHFYDTRYMSTNDWSLSNINILVFYFLWQSIIFIICINAFYFAIQFQTYNNIDIFLQRNQKHKLFKLSKLA